MLYISICTYCCVLCIKPFCNLKMSLCSFYFDLGSLIAIYGYEKSLNILKNLLDAVGKLKDGKWNELTYSVSCDSVNKGIKVASKFLKDCIDVNCNRSIPLVIRGAVVWDTDLYLQPPSHGNMISILNDWSHQPSIYVKTNKTIEKKMIRYCFWNYGDIITGSFLEDEHREPQPKKNDFHLHSRQCVVVALKSDKMLFDVSCKHILFEECYAESRYIMILEDLTPIINDPFFIQFEHIAIRHCRNPIYNKSIFNSTSVNDVKNMLELAGASKQKVLMTQIIAHELPEDWWSGVEFNSDIRYQHHCIYTLKSYLTKEIRSDDKLNSLYEIVTGIESRMDLMMEAVINKNENKNDKNENRDDKNENKNDKNENKNDKNENRNDIKEIPISAFKTWMNTDLVQPIEL